MPVIMGSMYRSFVEFVQRLVNLVLLKQKLARGASKLKRHFLEEDIRNQDVDEQGHNLGLTLSLA